MVIKGQQYFLFAMWHLTSSANCSVALYNFPLELRVVQCSSVPGGFISAGLMVLMSLQFPFPGVNLTARMNGYCSWTVTV